MSKIRTERLNELFAAWKQRIIEAPDRMCLDGIVCEKSYENTNPKLLFITKEPNHPEGPGFDFREWWLESIEYAFSYRLCEWSYGVQNGFPPLSEFDKDEANQSAAIRSISFMNLKKVGGSGSSDPEVIRSTTDRRQGSPSSAETVACGPCCFLTSYSKIVDLISEWPA